LARELNRAGVTVVERPDGLTVAGHAGHAGEPARRYRRADA
jgi:5-enolpyruvylshikimate-3-phosphate synthase